MSRLSITFGRRTQGIPHVSFQENRGTTWIGAHVVAADHLPAAARNGCAVVRRITDERGREWRVRQLWSENCHGLLFQCAVRGIRSEVRPMRGSLESLTDDELVSALAPTDD